MQLLQTKDRKILENLEIPRHESTKGLMPDERNAAIKGKHNLVF